MRLWSLVGELLVRAVSVPRRVRLVELRSRERQHERNCLNGQSRAIDGQVAGRARPAGAGPTGFRGLIRDLINLGLRLKSETMPASGALLTVEIRTKYILSHLARVPLCLSVICWEWWEVISQGRSLQRSLSTEWMAEAALMDSASKGRDQERGTKLQSFSSPLM